MDNRDTHKALDAISRSAVAMIVDVVGGASVERQNLHDDPMS
jgi:hypothetical protein